MSKLSLNWNWFSGSSVETSVHGGGGLTKMHDLQGICLLNTAALQFSRAVLSVIWLHPQFKYIPESCPKPTTLA